MKTNALIGIVGPCAAGKTTLASRLKPLGYRVKVIAQEHSYVPDLWKRFTHPDLLIYLDVSFPVSMQRRWMNWGPEEFEEQISRLADSREHANLYIDTDSLSIEEVLNRTLEFLQRE